MLSKLKKNELIEVAEELEISIPAGAKVLTIKDLIEKSDVYKNNCEVVKTVVEAIFEKKKEYEKNEAQKLEFERLKLAQLEKQLELANLQGKITQNVNVTSSDSDSNSSLECLIKSVKTLTIPVPTRAESYNLFFQSLERAFKTKNVPEQFKSEILLNILGEKATNLMIYLSEDEMCMYEKLKELVLKEFQSTPQEVLNNFRKAKKRPNESYIQFASRLSATFDYYCQLRKVNDFKGVCELMVSEKIFESLDRELQSHIGVKQGECWYVPPELAKHCDIYVSSKLKNDSNVFSRPQVVNHSQKYRKEYSTQKAFVSEVKIPKCVVCKSNENHSLNACPVFKNMLVNERIEVVKNKQLCFNCLNHHKVANCYSKSNCFVCKKRHHTLLHIREIATEDRSQNESVALNPRSNVFVPRIENPSNNSSRLPNESPASSTHSFTATSVNVNKMVLLSTANVLIQNNLGIFTSARALLDAGSMSHFISKRLADKLNLKKQKRNIVVSGLNQSSSVVNRVIKTKISNVNGSFEREIELLVVPEITDHIPSRQFDINTLEIDSFNLADVSFNKPGEVDILLGAQIFYELLRTGQIRFPDTDIVFQSTVFGFVATGSVQIENKTSVHCGLIIEDLDANLRKFWEIEEVEGDKLQNEESLICEDHFMKTHFRKDNGSYVVKMPFKIEPPCLGESKHIAIKRFNSLWKRLEREPEYMQLYREFLTEYENLGHMQEILETPKYIMPHHGVFRPESSTTKLRVVFNASEATSSGQSLNDNLYSGSVVQDDLFAILLRFRKHSVVFTADIKKMYRQIWIHPDQCDLQCILWKGSEEEKLRVFKLLTVTYGTKCAPYLATRVLNQLCSDEQNRYPLAAAAGKDFYVDDILSGTEDLSSAIELQDELILLLKSAGMELHKWSSNHPSLLQKVPTSDREYNFDNPNATTLKALGLQFNPKKDTFSFSVQKIVSPATKRTMLSDISRLFDPLGLLGPLIITAKILLQKLWTLKIDWDDAVPLHLSRDWEKFSSELIQLKDLTVDRHVLISKALKVDLIGFGDASKDAYGCAVYIRSVSICGDIKVSLLCSKSRVAPIKEISIPRLELCAAELLSKLIVKVMSSLKLEFNEVHLFSDSTVVLAWIKTPPSSLKVFVANRVSRIQEKTTEFQWHYVNTAENPADLISRGVFPSKIQQLDIWWNGPSFLSSSSWPHFEDNPDVSEEEYLLGAKRTAKNFELNEDSMIHFSLCATPNFLECLFEISNNYITIIRVLSYVFRFVKNLKGAVKTTGPLMANELNEAEKFILKGVQTQTFSKDIRSLQNQHCVPPGSKLKTLNPFLDSEGLLRVGGRLGNTNFSFNKKHQIILPRGHKLTIIIIEHFHKKYLHVGASSLLYLVREKFWPLNGRNSCRKVVHQCIICFKVQPTVSTQIMGNLPKERVSPDFAFNCAGADFCGPFYIKNKAQRKGALQKVYICIFVCFCFKAVHIEIVSDLSSNSFIAALKRFMARRGKCARLFSDNGRNFVGANKEIKRLHEMVRKPDERLAGYLATEGIEWKFIPPRSPHFGGLWEAAIRSFKYHLKRVVKGINLTYEEFLTVVVQIEGILNSRPLCPLSADEDDFEVLTPAHFLVNRSLTSITEPNLTNIKESHLKRWQKITRLVQYMWKFWHRHYLSQLQQRTKWMFEKNNVKLGDLVLLIEDNLPCYKWAMGRIIEIYFGDDGKIRVVKIKTQSSTFKRAISKICVLPMDYN